MKPAHNPMSFSLIGQSSDILAPPMPKLELLLPVCFCCYERDSSASHTRSPLMARNGAECLIGETPRELPSSCLIATESNHGAQGAG
ncbi:hypothetical protein AGOR_G00234150 [Albula goreensis]|uniref:Uncharacterized protein n=1 Tax=Albula goreensis TaxID=1534307 RepID=A0A8T3CIQ2_9TELE|nr:hypothetical protein AGOR_G00234150 [Albula goreensis]